MTDYPIIFSAPMVRALLGGNKTMTRRLAWREPKAMMVECKHGYDTCPTCDAPKPTPWQKVRPGDRLWVRESWWVVERHGLWSSRFVVFDDEWSKDERGSAVPDETAPLRAISSEARWGHRPSIHMPRAYSRLTLDVKYVRIEPLQSIEETDAKWEGVEPSISGVGPDGPTKTYRTGFVRLWGELHGTDSWLNNPDVVVLTFTVRKSNIDSLPAAA